MFMAFLHNLKSVFHFLIIFQCLVFSVFLLTSRTRRRSSLYLALFLIAVGLNELGGVFLHFLDLRRLIIAHLPQMLYLHIPLAFLAAPLLYAFVSSVVRKDYRLKAGDLLHLLPFAFYAVMIVLRYHSQSVEFMRRMAADEGPFSDPEDLVLSVVFFGQWMAYGWACFRLLRKHRQALKDYYSSVEPWSLPWLNTLLLAVLATRTLEMIEYGIWYATGSTWVVVLYYAAQVLFLVFLTSLFFRTLRLSQTFLAVVETVAPRVKYEKTLLPEAQRAQYARKLEQLMETEKPHLDPLISLGDLAKKSLIPPHYLSQVLNSHFGLNFFDFINSYRVRESQRLLADPAVADRTVLDVLLESGFNSKSVFNAAFKKHTGLTPSEYRRSLIVSSNRVA